MLIQILLAILLAGTAAVGVLAGSKTLQGFWINDRRTSFWLLVFTIVATQVGGGVVLGIAGSTYTYGLGFGVVALVSTVGGMILLAFVAPRISQLARAKDVYTLPEFIGAYLGRASRYVAAAIILVAYLSMLGGQLVAASTFVEVVLGGDYLLTIAISAIGVVLYGMVSGLRGDLQADSVLFFVMLVALGVTMYFVVSATGLQFSAASPDTFSLLKFGGYTYLIFGILFGAVIPLASMEMWMRIFASQDASTARRSFLASALLVSPFYVAAMFVGIAAVALGVQSSDPDQVMVAFTNAVMTTPFREFVLVSLVAVIVSTANTIVLVISAAIVSDLLPERMHTLGVSRIVVGLVGLMGLLFALYFSDIVQLVLNAFFMITVLLPSIFVILLGLRHNSAVLAAGMLLGFIATLVALPFLGNQAFLPGFAISLLTLGVSHVTAPKRTV